MVVEGDVDSRGIEVRWLDAAHPRLFRYAGKPRGDVRPLAAVVGRKPDVAVVGADPEDPGSDGRLGRRGDRAVGLGAGIVARDAAGELGAHDDARRILR